ncbi:CHAD domain-containing protein [Geoalkalibacter sp.]|uniref:CHAD domain-containing protein n=1 Tax=Geoalkalibacter sp. TaxID=3041440 RepID=UPI00272EA329|nr:CHAD domain-containing protein [Geoalkalibacter sp.]
MPYRHYLLGEDQKSLLDRLVSQFTLAEESHGSLALVYLDTFDWRLHQADLRLVEEDLCGKARIDLRHVDGTLLASGDFPAKVFAWDFPPGSLRQALEPLIEMRALLPVARLGGRRDLYAVLDRREKTVARIEFLAPQVRGNEDNRQALPPRLLVHSLKGFAPEARRLADFLEGPCGLTRSETGLFDESLAALGRRPGDYSSKINHGLTPALPAGQALRQVLRQLFTTLLANQPGVETALDSEFLHDFRVAVRRTRTALAQLKNVLPAREVEAFRKEFAWLGSITSPARDLDVYLLDFPRFQGFLPPEARADLIPFRHFLQRHQRTEYQRLVKHLQSSRFRALVCRWRDFLEQPGGLEETADGMKPIDQVADRRIWKIYRRVLREGQAIGPQSPPAELHELRKTCKKFRYLMEFFQSLYPAEDIGRLIKALKGLQDNLGAYQDLHVQVETLGRFSREMVAEGDTPAETLLALGRLVEGLDRRQAEVREEFSERFARFAREENQRLCRTLFKSSSPEQA